MADTLSNNTSNRSLNIRPYLRKILSNVEPGIKISKNTLDKLDEFINLIIKRIISNADAIAKYAHIATISPKELEISTEVTLPHQLGQDALDAGRRALEQYKNTALSRGIKSPTRARGTKETNKLNDKKGLQSGPLKNSSLNNSLSESQIMSAGIVSPRSGKRLPMRKASQAGLIMDVSRINHLIRHYSSSSRFSSDGPIFLAGVVEYLTSEIFHKTADLTRSSSKQMMNNSHLLDSLYVNPDLSDLSCNWLLNELSKLDNPNQEEQEELDDANEITED